MSKLIFIFCAGLAVLMMLPAVVVAREATASEFGSDKWRIQLTPLLWIAGVEGDAETRTGSVSTSTDFVDVAANLEFGFMGHAELAKGKFAVLLDGIYLDVGAEGNGPLGGDIDGNVQLALADVGLAYELWNAPLSNTHRTPRMAVDGIVGVRYIGLDVKLDPAMLQSRERSADLYDPYVGARLALAFNDKLSLVTKGTIGGFGVGADLDWTVGVFLDYRVASWFSVLAGYHVLHLDFEDGGHNNGLDLGATFHGPVVGMTFHF